MVEKQHDKYQTDFSVTRISVFDFTIISLVKSKDRSPSYLSNGSKESSCSSQMHSSTITDSAIDSSVNMTEIVNIQEIDSDIVSKIINATEARLTKKIHKLQEDNKKLSSDNQKLLDDNAEIKNEISHMSSTMAKMSSRMEKFLEIESSRSQTDLFDTRKHYVVNALIMSVKEKNEKITRKVQDVQILCDRQEIELRSTSLLSSIND